MINETSTNRGFIYNRRRRAAFVDIEIGQWVNGWLRDHFINTFGITQIINRLDSVDELDWGLLGSYALLAELVAFVGVLVWLRFPDPTKEFANDHFIFIFLSLTVALFFIEI